MPKTGNVRELYVRPPVSRFRREQEEQLVRKLTDIDRSTSVYAVASPEELQLTRDGVTRLGGYRYTWQGFLQLTQLLCGGAAQFLRDISGMTGGKENHLVDGLLAIHMFNELVALRFPCLETFRLVRNDELKLVDGLVGPNYQFLENASLFTMAKEVTTERLPFFCAELVGRRIVLWFRGTEPLVNLSYMGTPWPVYRGVYLCNAENHGTSLRGTLALFSRDGAALAPYKTYGERIKHAGNDFSSRVQQLLVKIFSSASGELPLVLQGLRGMTRQSLQFSEDMNEKEYRRHHQRVVHGLRQLQVPLGLAEEVMTEVLFAECTGDRAIWEPMILTMFARRNLMDMAVALLRGSRKLDIARREVVGHAAFSVMMGKLVI